MTPPISSEESKSGLRTPAPTSSEDESSSGVSTARFSSLEGETDAITDKELHERNPLVEPTNNESSLETEMSCSATFIGQQNLAEARRLLFVSHFFAQFSECAWQFALTLFLAAITNYKSLILVSSYGLVQGLSVCLLGATAGRFVDCSNRLFAACFFIWSENLCVLIATAFCCLLLGMDRDEQQDDSSDNTTGSESSSAPSWIQRKFQGVPMDTWSLLYLLAIHVFGPVAQILDQGFMVAIERDWVVTMSKVAAAEEEGKEGNGGDDENLTFTGPNKAWLSDTNVAMRRIDLTCKVVAPAVAGLLIGAFDHVDSSRNYGSNLTGAALLVGVVNVAALFVEYICTARIYDLIPSLAVKQCHIAQVQQQENVNTPALLKKSDDDCALCKLPHGLSVYVEQPIAWAGLSLAMLYLNALTFGALMTAYLVWRGMPLQSVGIWRGVSSAVGLTGTFVYHYSVKRITVVSTSMWSIWYQFACVSLSFASLFVDSYDLSMAMLIFGVCASRVGLWVFDLSVTQLMQEFVPDGIRGVVGGTQQALNSFFSLLTFALGFIFPDPREFPIYAAAGYSAVGIAAVIFAFGIHRRADDFFILISS